MSKTPRAKPELLAPAGTFEAGLAAIQYGADAVYAGLKRFSARADAGNLTADELADLVAYARSRTPRRRVYAALNTLVLDAELPEVASALEDCARAGVDAVIVQDLGVHALARRHFPELRLHASTQLAIHGLPGAVAAGRLGFARATLARELTLEEIRAIALASPIEVEVFVHGALCYSYSGLCLISSNLAGRSGNRGRCAYLCRQAFSPAEGGDETDGGLPFSMKDLALPDHLADLATAGAASLKIEGRKKSALYVAAVTDYYRRLLDGSLGPRERDALEEDIRTIFSREWTALFIEGESAEDPVDPRGSTHVGAPVGEAEAIVFQVGEDAPYLRFRTRRRLEVRDGLQVVTRGGYRPFGWPVEGLRAIEESRRGIRRREAFVAEPGSLVEVALPSEFPDIPPGTTVYCSSSQAVKQRYTVRPPAASELAGWRDVDARVELREKSMRAAMTLAGRALGVTAEASVDIALEPARDAAAVTDAARKAFAKLGGTRYRLAALEIDNPGGLFAPVSALNELRRRTVLALDEAFALAFEERSRRVAGAISTTSPPAPSVNEHDCFLWTVRADRAEHLSAFDAADFAAIEEILLDVSPEDMAERDIEDIASRAGRDKLRLLLPPVVREREEPALTTRVRKLIASGWRKWQVANLASWGYLGTETSSLDVATDWTLYVTNRLAGTALTDLGCTRVTLSPEDGLPNMRPLLNSLGERAVVIVHQDTPLMISETPPASKSEALVTGRGQEVSLIERGGRTFILNQRTYCVSGRLDELRAAGARRLRADFALRRYSPDEALDHWRAVRAGRPVEGTQQGNYERGLA